MGALKSTQTSPGVVAALCRFGFSSIFPFITILNFLLPILCRVSLGIDPIPGEKASSVGCAVALAAFGPTHRRVFGRRPRETNQITVPGRQDGY